MVTVEFEEVAKAFGGYPVLEEATFSVAAGTILGVIGDNGAGKTTLLRLTAGLLVPTSGTVRVLGNADLDAVRQRIGALIERPGHYNELTVAENLALFYEFYSASRDECASAVERALAAFTLTPVARERAGRLSTGYRQRLALARAIHPWARLLLLDEPFESLDPVARHQLRLTLQEARAAGLTALVSSHTLRDLEGLCDRFLLVADRRVVAFRAFSEMRAQLGLPDEADLDFVYATYRRLRPSAGGT